MKQFERQLIWQSRIQAFHTSGEANAAAWCAKERATLYRKYWTSILQSFICNLQKNQ